MKETYAITIGVVALLIILDIASGWSAAIATKSIDSSKMRNGLWHKLAYAFAIALAGILEWSFVEYHVNFGVDIPLLVPVCLYIGVTEISSIIENIAIINPDLVGSPLFSLFSRTKDDHYRARSKDDKSGENLERFSDGNELTKE